MALFVSDSLILLKVDEVEIVVTVNDAYRDGALGYVRICAAKVRAVVLNGKSNSTSYESPWYNAIS